MTPPAGFPRQLEENLRHSLLRDVFGINFPGREGKEVRVDKGKKSSWEVISLEDSDNQLLRSGSEARIMFQSCL